MSLSKGFRAGYKVMIQGGASQVMFFGSVSFLNHVYSYNIIIYIYYYMILYVHICIHLSRHYSTNPSY